MSDDGHAPAHALALREDAVDWRLVGDEVIAIERESSTYLAANATGSELWQRLAAGTTLRELVDLIVSRHGISTTRARADVERFLMMLDERGILVRAA